MATVYYATYSAGVASPTCSTAGVWSGAPVWTGSSTGVSESGSAYKDATGLSASTPYDSYAAWSDGTVVVMSAVETWSTAPAAALGATIELSVALYSGQAAGSASAAGAVLAA